MVLLVSIIFPHHHHEEIVCYTSAHCETDNHPEGNIVEGLEDHHHDHNTSEGTEQCISLEYYIATVPGKNLKQSVTCVEKLVFSDNLQAAFLDSDYTADIEAGSDHGGHFIPSFIHLTAIDAFNR